MTKPDLDAIRARVEAATYGPWAVIDDDGPSVVVSGAGLTHSIDFLLATDGKERGWADAEFVAHAREDVPALLAYIEQLESDLKTV